MGRHLSGKALSANDDRRGPQQHPQELKNWWECDTGIAYLVARSASDGWYQSGSKQHLRIYDLSDPAHPVYIRDFGLVRQQPRADVDHAQNCMNAPGANCYEGTKNPPPGVHGPISMGPAVKRVYMPYGVGADGVIQILDREKLLNGCKLPTASKDCATNPTQAEQHANYGDGTPQQKNLPHRRV